MKESSMQKDNHVPATHSDQPIVADSQVENQVEKEIDLNLLYPEEGTDLNALFPESDLKSLLKKVRKNRKDIEKMAARFEDELLDDPLMNKTTDQKEND